MRHGALFRARDDARNLRAAPPGRRARLGPPCKEGWAVWLWKNRAESIRAPSTAQVGPSGRGWLAELVLGIGTSHGSMLSTPPHEWDGRAGADRRNKALAFRGKTYSFDQL